MAQGPGSAGPSVDVAEPDSRPALPGDLLLHPVAFVALIVVIVNDRVLKVHHAGAVSGKLSDFAGLIYFPLFVATLIEVAQRVGRRTPWMIQPRVVDALTMVTGIIFAGAKLWEPWANAYRLVFGVVWWPLDALASLIAGDGWPSLGRLGLVQDWTDLVALPVLALPPIVARRVTQARSARSAGSGQST